MENRPSEMVKQMRRVLLEDQVKGCGHVLRTFDTQCLQQDEREQGSQWAKGTIKIGHSQREAR